MLQRGDESGDVAYWFGVAEEDLDEALSEYESSQIKGNSDDPLPPRGPYPSVRSAHAAIDAIRKALDLLNAARAVAGLTRKDFVLQKVEEPARLARPRVRRKRRPTKPPQYRPVTAKPRPPVERQTPSTEVEPDQRERSLPIHVRLLFEHRGFCRITLLPRRALDMSEELEVESDIGALALFMLQDEWFDDVLVSEAGRLMQEGTVWTAKLKDGELSRWVLTGRDIYVLSSSSDLSGFVSTARLVIGEEHIVLCTEERVDAVRSALDEAGCSAPPMLHADSGIPSGWAGFQDVRPTRAVAPGPDGDILNVLRPRAEIEIVLDGGIKIDRSAWLIGHPPRIEIHGDAGSAGNPVIDGQEAALGPDGSYSAASCGEPGEHSVFCGGQSRSYSIVGGAEKWEAWQAHRWPLEPINHDRAYYSVCGVLVRPPLDAAEGCHAVIVPASNTLLLGAIPGQLAASISRKDYMDGIALAFPDFDPVWAVPSDPLRCDKRASRILLIGKTRPVARPAQAIYRTGADANRLRLWCNAILNSARKNLKCEPSGRDAADLWRSYKKCARSIWKTMS